MTITIAGNVNWYSVCPCDTFTLNPNEAIKIEVRCVPDRPVAARTRDFLILKTAFWTQKLVMFVDPFLEEKKCQGEEAGRDKQGPRGNSPAKKQVGFQFVG